MKKSTINFTVQLDANNVPDKILWDATDKPDPMMSETKSISIALWDEKQKNTLRIDLWTKDMMVDEMAEFFFQSMMTMADTFKRATQSTPYVGQADDIRDFAREFSRKFIETQKKEEQQK